MSVTKTRKNERGEYTSADNIPLCVLESLDYTAGSATVTHGEELR